MNKKEMQATIDRLHELRADDAVKIKELLKQLRTIQCYFCGATFAYDDPAQNEHWRNCPDHPARVELERLRTAMQELITRNPLRNDRDAYELALAEWGLKGKWGIDEEFDNRPNPVNFGLS